MFNKNKKRGFSIIEAILYIGILGIILTVVTNMSLDSLQEKSNQQSRQAVKQDAEFVIDKISYELENAERINTYESIFGSATNAGKLVLNTKTGDVVEISLSGSQVYYKENTGDAVPISSPDTEITELNFIANTSGGNTPNEVQVKLHAKAKSGGTGETVITQYEEDFQTSIVSKSADSDNDGCLDVVDQFPLDSDCCTDTDGDEICDKEDNCPLVHNMDQRDDDGDLVGHACDDFVDTGEGGGEEEGEEGGGGSCVIGKKLGIWIDSNNNGDVNAGEPYLGNITAYSGDLSAAENYNYFSYSAHPINGPAPDPFESQVFFYDGADGLSLNFFHNVDSDDHSEGSSDNEVDWWINTDGNNLLDGVMISDDNNELTQYFIDYDNEKKSYHGAFHYWYNTDGGAIGPFEGENYKIHVSVDEIGDVLDAAFYSADGEIRSLMDGESMSSFIIKYETYEDCSEDDDGDGVPDELDICPGFDDTVDTDSDGTPDGCDTDDDDGDGVLNESDVCPGYDDNVDENNNGIPDGCDGGGGEIDYCALETEEEDEDSDQIIGGTWEGLGTVDSCIYTCNYKNSFWQTICQKFECFYTGNQNSFETNIDNNEYAGVGQVFSLEPENMYWKKIFKLNVADDAISKVDRFKFSLNYCHGGSRLSTWWLRGRCSNKGKHLNGNFEGDQTVEIFNNVTKSWDIAKVLQTYSNNNKEVYAEFEYSSNLRDYINSNKEVTTRIKFRADGAPWGHHQRWYFAAPSRYLFLDYFNLETHIQGLAFCGDGNKEMDEQCDDGSQCSDGTDCTNYGDCKCVGIGDEECKPRNYIGLNCSDNCLNELSVCGNGLIEENEECDDNNSISGDGCDSSCAVETCGNGSIEAPEECDPGPKCENGDSCTTNANCEDIGDEQCLMRDGDEDQCSQFCLDEICGNGRLEASEECEDGNLIDGDGCNSICRLEVCGNDIEDEGEKCDDGNTIDDDNCNNACEIQFCGDGMKNRAVEECDNGKQCGDAANTGCDEDADCAGIGDNLCLVRSGDGCDENCFNETAICGNGDLETGEECDDSNLNDGDGCSHTCMQEYTVDYDISDPAHKAYLVLSTNLPHKVALDDYEDFELLHNYPANGAYQVEFDQLDGILSQAVGTSYNKIKSMDGLEFIAESLTPWLSYLKIIPQTYASLGFIAPEGNKYLNHKFSFQIQEAEYNPANESSPKRIDYVQLTWEGRPQPTKIKDIEKRKVYMYVWKNNDWEKLDTESWSIWFTDNSREPLTFKLQSDLSSYLDSENKIHFMVETNKKGYNILATDYVKLEVKGYGYRADFE